ncbi:thioredoxin-dependent thiol peroxidase [Candidatus Thorarchaeota archaeon]|nr:MAG: thioredoxin-dependent thiol peroxidase [Candidatus Thorarchaeota archaeon]
MLVKVGDRAPLFTTTTESGEKFKLSDYKGKKIVLYWYVKDNTPGCQAQSCSLRDNYEVFSDNDTVVVGIAPGTAKSHQSFKEKNNLPFPLLLDEDNKIAQLYGVWGKKSMYGKEYEGIIRTTFLIDEKGKIASILGGSEGIEKVNTKAHADQIVKVWNLKV